MNHREHRATEDHPLWIAKSELQCLIDILRLDGYTVVGPSIDQGSIVYREIESTSQLPIGWRDVQQPGAYRLQSTGTESYFEFNVGPHSWKQFLFPPRQTIASADLSGSQWQFATNVEAAPKYALLGVRACELEAIRVQDRVFLGGAYVDSDYRARREKALILAVNCTVAGSNCFCTSMNAGPRCSDGFDLALTEIDDGFVLEIGSEAGARLGQLLKHQAAPQTAIDAAQQVRSRAVDQMSKQLDTHDIRDLLLNNLDHPRWDDVAQRCLSCTNCTMVCPTCFCTSVSEVSDLDGQHVDRVRQWDSCFNVEFSNTASGNVRGDIRSRYRQWLTHKLASWHDQFDTSGCVGCGRCITWCPVGIDLTEEVAAIREKPASKRSLPVLQQPPIACTVSASRQDLGEAE